VWSKKTPVMSAIVSENFNNKNRRLALNNLVEMPAIAGRIDRAIAAVFDYAYLDGFRLH
jgi:hypothetical protein